MRRGAAGLRLGWTVISPGDRSRWQALADDGPAIGEVVKRGGPQFFIPIAVLMGLLIAGFTPTYCAGAGIVTLIAVSWMRKGYGMGPRRIYEALGRGAGDMILTAVLLVGVGVVVNAIATTGIGNTFSLMINQWAGGSLLVALVLIALASLVLGMGLPVTASYVVLATLSLRLASAITTASRPRGPL